MRSKGSPIELEHRRRLAVRRLLDGYSTAAVADFLGVNERSVRRWFALFQRHGTAGLASQPVLGRPRKLSRTQEKIIWRWLADRPTAYGFSTELWTCARLSQLIQEEWDIVLNPHYLADWLRAHGLSPQKPARVPRQRDPEAIAAWLEKDWPRIKKKRGGSARTSF
jgi:transposase